MQDIEIKKVIEVVDPFDPEASQTNDVAFVIYEHRVNTGKRKTFAYLEDPFLESTDAEAAVNHRVSQYVEAGFEKVPATRKKAIAAVKSTDGKLSVEFEIRHSKYYYGSPLDKTRLDELDTLDLGNRNKFGKVNITFSRGNNVHNTTTFDSERDARAYKEKIAAQLKFILGPGAVTTDLTGTIRINVRDVITIK